MMLRRLLMGAALLLILGCSSSSEQAAAPEAKSEAARPEVVASPTPPSGPQAPAPTEAPPPSPYEGLSAEKISFYKQAEGMLVPVGKMAAAKYEDLKEGERRANAVMTLSRYKVSLNRDAEKRLRATLGEITTADAMTGQFLLHSRELWPVGFKPGTYDRVSEVGSLVASTYERALDEGADVPDDIRRLSASMVRSEGPPVPEFEVNAGKLVDGLRTDLLGQTVTGDYLFLVALAVRERGDGIIRCREWLRRVDTLVRSIPPAYRTDVILSIAWSSKAEEELRTAMARFEEHRFQRQAMTLDDSEYTRKQVRERQKTVEMIRSSMLALEQGRRDTIEGHFRKVDAEGWEALVKLDELLGELQKVLDTILPDLEYRFRPLLPPDAPRGVEENVLAKLPLPGSVEDRLPTVELVAGSQVIEIGPPSGKPKLKELVKAGQVFGGWFKQGNVSCQDVELEILVVSGDAVTGELRIKHGEGVDKLPIKGEFDAGKLKLRAEWNPPNSFPRTLAFEGSSVTGAFAGDLNLNGSFSFEPKK